MLALQIVIENVKSITRTKLRFALILRATRDDDYCACAYAILFAEVHRSFRVPLSDSPFFLRETSRGRDAGSAKGTSRCCCRAEPEQNRRQQIRGRADRVIANSGDDCAERSDEILRRMIRRRNVAEPDPGRHILRRVGNQGEKKQRPDAEQDEGEDFVPGAIF